MKKVQVSITYKAMFVFALVLVPLLVVSFVSYRYNREHIEGLTFGALNILAEKSEGDVLLFQELIKRRIADFSTDGTIRSESARLARGAARDGRRLGEYMKKNKLVLDKSIYRLSIVSKEGRVLSSTVSSLIGKDISKEEFFIKSLTGAGVTERAKGYWGVPELVVSTPVYSLDTNEMTAVIMGFVPLSEFSRVVSGEFAEALGAVTGVLTGQFKTLEVLIINRDKLMIVNSRKSEALKFEQVVDTRPVNSCLERNEEIAGSWQDYMGTEIAGASMCFPEMGWTLVAKINKEEILEPLTRSRQYFMMASAVTITLIGALFFLFFNTVAAQLRRLATAAKTIASGDYDISLKVKGGDEMALVAESFNNMARDIKAKNIELGESAARLSEAQRIAHVGNWERDIATDKGYWSDEACRILGIEPCGTVEAAFEKFLRFVHPEDVERLKNLAEDALKTGGRFSVDYRIIKPDGAERLLHGQVEVRLDGEGRPLKMLGVVQDITERARAEEALRKSGASLANAQRIARLGSWDWDIVENELFWSDEIYRIFGIRPQEFEATYEGFFKFVHPEDRDLLNKAVEDALNRGKHYSIDHRIVLPDGTEKIIHEEAEVTFDRGGKPVKMSGTVQDVTEHKKAERLLEESERKYRNLVETALVGVYRISIDGKILFANDTLARMFEFDTTEEFIAEGALARYPAAEDMERFIEELKRKRTLGAAEQTFITKTGKIKNILFTAMLEDSTISGTAIDITDRKRAEEEVRKLNVELERRVDERTAQLAEANRELEAFSYSVAHDLKGPLRLIDGFTNILVKKHADNLDKDGHDTVRRLREASNQMGRIIDDLLELSQVVRSEMIIEEVNLSDMASAILSGLRKAQPERKAEFIVEKGLMSRADKGLIRMMLENLLGNAWKFTSKREVARIEFGAAGKKDGKTIFFVRDNGAGFESKYAPRLFTPFQRLHSTDDFPGTGIGLATVQRIIKRHNGAVWAEGEVGKGAVFYFTL